MSDNHEIPSVIEPSPKRRGRPKGSTKAVLEAKRAEREAISAMLAVPSNIDSTPPVDPNPDVELVESFFAAHGSTIEPGKNLSNLICDHRKYISGDTPGCEFRFGSFRAGAPEHNAAGGFIPALRDPKTGKLSPTGKEVVIGSPVNGARPMQLLVRRKEHGDIRRGLVTDQSLKAAASKENEAQSAARDLGLKTNLTANSSQHDAVVGRN